MQTEISSHYQEVSYQTLKNGPNKIPIPFKILFMLKDLAISKVH